jgi:hypothetical protein
MKIKTFNEHTTKETLIVSAFPGCGKSYLFNKSDKIILDSDSSKFDKTEFPQNYIKHIKENIGKADIILVSSHKDVRDSLVANSIDFTLVYPDIDLKDDYINRYVERCSPQPFIDLISKNWDNWINEMCNQIECKTIRLKKGQFLSDVIN